MPGLGISGSALHYWHMPAELSGNSQQAVIDRDLTLSASIKLIMRKPVACPTIAWAKKVVGCKVKSQFCHLSCSHWSSRTEGHPSESIYIVINVRTWPLLLFGTVGHLTERLLEAVFTVQQIWQSTIGFEYSKHSHS